VGSTCILHTATAYWILGAALILIGIGAGYIQFGPAPSYEEPVISDLEIEITPERVAEGRRIASMLCNECHSGSDGKLSGKKMIDVPPVFGVFYSANITQHAERGVGKWTDGEMYNFLRTGLRRDGSFAAIMPQFPKVSDEEMYSVIAYLRSDDERVQPSERPSIPSRVAFLGKFLMKFVLKPAEFPAMPIIRPDSTNQLALGRYLADDLYSCFDCHSASFTTNNRLEPEKSKGFYGGGNELLDEEGKPIYSTNLTPDPETGIGNYTEEGFIQALKYGRKPNDEPLRYPMRPHTAMTDTGVKAIFAYLKSLPPIHNPIAGK
jgi:mono/diheme cytochrome c family protein